MLLLPIVQGIPSRSLFNRSPSILICFLTHSSGKFTKSKAVVTPMAWSLLACCLPTPQTSSMGVHFSAFSRFCHCLYSKLPGSLSNFLAILLAIFAKALEGPALPKWGFRSNALLVYAFLNPLYGDQNNQSLRTLKGFVYAVNFDIGGVGFQDFHYPMAHVSIKGIVGRKNFDVVLEFVRNLKAGAPIGILEALASLLLAITQPSLLERITTALPSY